MSVPTGTGPHVRIPNTICWDGTLSPAAKVLLLALVAHTNQRGECWPTQPLLVAETGASLSVIKRALRELRGRGYLSVTVEKTPKGRRNRYLLDLRGGGVISDLTGGVISDPITRTI